MAGRAAQKLIHNEQTKLLANYFNGVAVAIMTAGVLAPIIGLLTGASVAGPLQLAVLVVSCMFISGALHSVARVLLRGLQE